MNRSVDIALDLCTQMEDTLLGNPPVVPVYFSAQDTLSKLVRLLDGKPATRMVGKVKPMQTIQQQTDHLTTSEYTLKVTAGPHNGPLDTLPTKLQNTVSNTSRPHTKQQINNPDASAADHDAENSVQQINELLDLLPAKLQNTVSNTSRPHTKQQINNTDVSAADHDAENSVQQINELLDISPAKLQNKVSNTSRPHASLQNSAQ